MSDLIERGDAIKALDANFTIKGKENMQTVLNYLELVRTRIEDAPSVEPKRGEWIEVRSFDAFGGDEAAWMAHGNPIAFHYCSECKEQTRLDEFGEEMLSKYCPNCGADMRKGADDE